MALQTRHLSIAIARSAEAVYDFVCRPQNLPLWASGLGKVELVQGRWVAQGAEGIAQLRFIERNNYGVLDHWVTTPAGAEIYIPLRVIANSDGCEVVFTLFRQHERSNEKFEADAEWVMRDLAKLKQIMEADT